MEVEKIGIQGRRGAKYGVELAFVVFEMCIVLYTQVSFSCKKYGRQTSAASLVMAGILSAAFN
jgi:NADH:ubiquinone oxidoreductase subunit 3 (subunit A)